MILTGLAVEIALIPFALYHFHKAGLYGVAANLLAIPLTTFVIMPLEAGALAPRPRRAGRAAVVGGRACARRPAVDRALGRGREGRGGDACRPCRLGLRS